ncbi:MAG: hypothetical protein HFJ06_08505 [Lachnospiraceae bacterium]|nr:hypothetical protein [Lachnospiraceae bacterium]
MIKDSAYSVKSVSTDAVIACILAGISLCCMLGALLISYLYDGKGPAAVGLLGIGSLILAVLGIIFTVYAWKSEDGGLLMKRIAGVLNTIPLLVAVIFYIWGWM